MKIKMNYEKQESKKELITYLKKFIDKDTIIMNIGTNKVIFDSVAPFLGTMLNKSNFPLKVFGTLENPVHALNLETNLSEIKSKYPKSKIIGIDASLGNLKSVGDIIVRDVGISPGRGVGKTLSNVGDISIVGIVDDVNNNSVFREHVRLDFIYEMAESIHNILIESVKDLHINNSEVATSM